MNQNIRFGTDGWRGRIADDYTFANVRRCTQGFASYLIENGNQGERVVVGYDRRFNSEFFAAAAAEVLAGNGLRVLLTDRATPTPVISYAVVSRSAASAINITASHNPPTDNGFKVRDENGGAIGPEGLGEIERLIPASDEDARRIPLEAAIRDGAVEKFDANPEYITHLDDLIDLEPIKNAGLTILAEPMWGNGTGWFANLLNGGTTRVIEIHRERNPIFPEMKRPEPIQPNVDVGLQATLDNEADVMIATDGDADRVGIGDENGVFIDQLRVYALLAYYLLEVRGLRGPIVRTLSTTTMLDKLGRIYDVPVYKTGVGFKYVAPKMLETNAMIGGEESGGYAFANHVPERDGILAGLYILDMMVQMGASPSKLIESLFEKVGSHFYDRIDTPFSGDRQDRIDKILSANPASIGGFAVTGLETTDGYKFNLDDGGWLLIRFSGTEPIIRVYTETTDEGRVQAILKDGLQIAGLG
ncbi:MAG: phosphoglucomutase/phosphomannomutase family protein [Anaerolineales bacterium]|nr:phosphoglucomutase/phosphomannomutase family protein [Anaerolineales bacterium]